MLPRAVFLGGKIGTWSWALGQAGAVSSSVAYSCAAQRVTLLESILTGGSEKVRCICRAGERVWEFESGYRDRASKSVMLIRWEISTIVHIIHQFLVFSLRWASAYAASRSRSREGAPCDFQIKLDTICQTVPPFQRHTGTLIGGVAVLTTRNKNSCRQKRKMVATCTVPGLRPSALFRPPSVAIAAERHGDIEALALALGGLCC